MFKQLNSKVIIKCFIAAVLMLLTGMVIQIANGLLIFKKEPPELSFIMSVTVAYIVMGFLYSLAFYIFRNKIPGKTPLQKGIVHSLFVLFIVLFPGVLGMVAFDHEGLYNLFTPYKIETYIMYFIDIVNFLINGVILSILFKKDIVITEMIAPPRKKAVVSGVIGFFLFPALMFTFHVLFEQLQLFDYSIPNGAETWYYIGLMAPLSLAGALLPLFYYYIKDMFDGSWLKKSVCFAIVFFALYWIIVMSFILIFGYSIQLVLFYLLISIPSLLLCNIITGFIYRDKEKIGEID